jgi:hypothetical protein
MPQKIMSYEYSIRIPESDRALFRQWARKMGWGLSRPKKVLDEPNEETLQAIKDIESGVGLEPLDLDHFDEYVAAL